MSGNQTAAQTGKVRLKPLNEQVMVITGATSGIGLTAARDAVKAGASVVFCARDAGAVEQLERDLTAHGEALGVVCDVTNERDVRALAQAAIDRYGRIDTWVNNAGVSIYGRLEDIEIADMRQLFEINFWGVVHGSLTALEHMKERGGAIINIGSTLSERAIPIQGIYCASKFAVRGFTDAFRMEVEKSNYPIAVTLIKPSAIDTPYIKHAKNYLPEEPKNPPPVYAPDLVADAILHCAVRAERDIFVGGAGMMFGLMEKLMPHKTDKVMEATLFEIQQSGEPAKPRGDASLYAPSGPELHERGGYQGKVFETSPYTAAKMNREFLGLAALGAGIGLGILAAACLAPRRDEHHRVVHGDSWVRDNMPGC
jgi:NAD(P)-dependent dehydrogenase (short-subunit alcohol dehydrogenase family)